MNYDSAFEMKVIEELQNDAIKCLRHDFPSLTNEDDIKDIIQDSNEIFYKKIVKPDFKLTSSLNAYFIGICKNQTLRFFAEKKRQRKLFTFKYKTQKSFLSLTHQIVPFFSHHIREHNNESIIWDGSYRDVSVDDNPEKIKIREEKKEKIRNMLKNMTAHCYDLLWNHYGKGYSWYEVSEKIDGLANEESAKTSGFRCLKKFVEKYQDIITK